jgi:predicted P-loop ATPase
MEDAADAEVTHRVRREVRLTLDELARERARRMLVATQEAEVAEYLERQRGETDESGWAHARLSDMHRYSVAAGYCSTVWRLTG